MGLDSSVGIAPRYGLDGPGIESPRGRGEILRTSPERPWGTPSLPYNRYSGIPGGKQPRCDSDTPLHPAPGLKKEYSYTSTPPPGLLDLFYSEIYLTILPLHINRYPAIFQWFSVPPSKFRNKLIRPRHLPFKYFSKFITYWPSYLSDAIKPLALESVV